MLTLFGEAVVYKEAFLSSVFSPLLLVGELYLAGVVEAALLDLLRGVEFFSLMP